MKRFGVIISAMLMVAALALPALGQSGPPPEHGHVRLLHVTTDATGFPVAWRKCVDVANAQALGLNAHHDHLHTGRAGMAQRVNAGHMTVPLHPLVPGAHNCADLERMFAAGAFG
jgi:hypothetical protein